MKWYSRTVSQKGKDWNDPVGEKIRCRILYTRILYSGFNIHNHVENNGKKQKQLIYC